MANLPGGEATAASSAEDDAQEEIPEIAFFCQEGAEDFDNEDPEEDPDYDAELCESFLREKRFKPFREEYHVDGTQCFTDAILWRGTTAHLNMARQMQRLQQESNPEKKAFLEQHMLESTDMITVMIDWAPDQTAAGQKLFHRQNLPVRHGISWWTAHRNESYVIVTLPSRAYTRGPGHRKDAELHKVAVTIFVTNLREHDRPQMYMDKQICISTFACPDADSLIHSIKAKVQQGEMVIPLHRLQEDKYINLLRCVLAGMSDWCLALTLQVFRHVEEHREQLQQVELRIRTLADIRKRLNTARSALELFLVDRVLLFQPEAPAVLDKVTKWLTSRDLSLAAGKEGDMDVYTGPTACQQLVMDVLSNMKASVNFAIRRGPGQVPRICKLHPDTVENMKLKCSLLFTDNVAEVKDLPGSANKGKHALIWVCRLSAAKLAAKQHWGAHQFWLIARIHVVMSTAHYSQRVTVAPPITELPRLMTSPYGFLVLDPKGHADSGADGIDASLPGSRLLTLLLETANKELWIYQILSNWLNHLQEQGLKASRLHALTARQRLSC